MSVNITNKNTITNVEAIENAAFVTVFNFGSIVGIDDGDELGWDEGCVDGLPVG